MNRFVLVTGGARSGKSNYAQKRAEDIVGSKCFLATCPSIDSEMDQRIKNHKKERLGKGWDTIEEQLDITSILKKSEYSLYLVDCLTLWVNNLVFEAEKKKVKITEKDIVVECKKIIKTVVNIQSHVFFVTNEVGMSVVPDNQSARYFRDMVGRCNQLIAEAADEVVLVSCGIPLRLK